MTVWAVTTTHAAGELAAAHRIAAGLPELLTDAQPSSSLSRYSP